MSVQPSQSVLPTHKRPRDASDISTENGTKAKETVDTIKKARTATHKSSPSRAQSATPQPQTMQQPQQKQQQQHQKPKSTTHTQQSPPPPPQQARAVPPLAPLPSLESDMQLDYQHMRLMPVLQTNRGEELEIEKMMHHMNLQEQHDDYDYSEFDPETVRKNQRTKRRYYYKKGVGLQADDAEREDDGDAGGEAVLPQTFDMSEDVQYVDEHGTAPNERGGDDVKRDYNYDAHPDAHHAYEESVVQAMKTSSVAPQFVNQPLFMDTSDPNEPYADDAVRGDGKQPDIQMKCEPVDVSTQPSASFSTHENQTNTQMDQTDDDAQQPHDPEEKQREAARLKREADAKQAELEWQKHQREMDELHRRQGKPSVNTFAKMLSVAKDPAFQFDGDKARRTGKMQHKAKLKELVREREKLEQKKKMKDQPRDKRLLAAHEFDWSQRVRDKEELQELEPSPDVFQTPEVFLPPAHPIAGYDHDKPLDLCADDVDYVMTRRRNEDPYESTDDPAQIVPVLRVFGRTENNQQVLVHVHGFRPYFYVKLPNDVASKYNIPTFKLGEVRRHNRRKKVRTKENPTGAFPSKANSIYYREPGLAARSERVCSEFHQALQSALLRNTLQQQQSHSSQPPHVKTEPGSQPSSSRHAATASAAATAWSASSSSSSSIDQEKAVCVVSVEMLPAKSIMHYGYGERGPVMKVTVNTPKLIVQARELLMGRGLTVFGEAPRQLPPLQVWGTKQSKMEVFDCNIEFPLRFMFDVGLRGSSWVRLPAMKFTSRPDKYQSSLFGAEIDVHYQSLVCHSIQDDAWKKANAMRVFSFDIEAAAAKGHFPHPNNDPVVTIAATMQKLGSKERHTVIFSLGSCRTTLKNTHVFCFEDEGLLLRSFAKFLRDSRPDILTGYNIKRFDIPYLLKRAAKFELRDFPYWSGIIHPTNFRVTIFRSRGTGAQERIEIDSKGLLIIDMLDIMRAGHKLRSYTLNACALTFLGIAKNDVHHSQITPMTIGPKATESTRTIIANYCAVDTYLPLGLGMDLQKFLNLIEMARVSGVPISCGNRRGEGVLTASLMTRMSMDKYRIKPFMERAATGAATAGTGGARSGGPQFRGAIVKEPKRGYYTKWKDPKTGEEWDEYVITLDFASLYPSIMQAWNLCFSTLIHPNDLWRVPESKRTHIFINKEDDWWFHDEPPRPAASASSSSGAAEKKDKDEKAESSDVKVKAEPPLDPDSDEAAELEDQRGILPEILTELLAARNVAKRDMAEAEARGDALAAAIANGRQLALKIRANSVYGYSTGFDVWCKAVGASVTWFGRMLIELTTRLIEENFNTKMINPRTGKPFHCDAKVIYGDTDSVMIRWLEKSRKAALDMGLQMFEFVNDPKRKHYKHPIRLEFEKVYENMNLMNKKRYGGNKVTYEKVIDDEETAKAKAEYDAKAKQLQQEYEETVRRYTQQPAQIAPEKWFLAMGIKTEKKQDGKAAAAAATAAGIAQLPPPPPSLPPFVPKKKTIIVSKIDTKGVEDVRRDNCPLLLDSMKMMWNGLLVDADTLGVIDRTKNIIRAVRNGDQRLAGISKLIISKSIARDDYKDKPAHVKLNERMEKREKGSGATIGERRSYIIVPAPKKAPMDARMEDPKYAIQHNIRPDTDYYIEKQLRKPMSRALFWPMAKLMRESGNPDFADLDPERREYDRERVQKAIDDIFDSVLNEKGVHLIKTRVSGANFFAKSLHSSRRCMAIDADTGKPCNVPVVSEEDAAAIAGRFSLQHRLMGVAVNSGEPKVKIEYERERDQAAAAGATSSSSFSSSDTSSAAEVAMEVLEEPQYEYLVKPRKSLQLKFASTTAPEASATEAKEQETKAQAENEEQIIQPQPRMLGLIAMYDDKDEYEIDEDKHIISQAQLDEKKLPLDRVVQILPRHTLDYAIREADGRLRYVGDRIIPVDAISPECWVKLKPMPRFSKKRKGKIKPKVRKLLSRLADVNLVPIERDPMAPSLEEAAATAITCQTRSKVVCDEHVDQTMDVYMRHMEVVRGLERDYAAIWSGCQRCAGTLTQADVCGNHDCPLFFRRLITSIELEQAIQVSELF